MGYAVRTDGVYGVRAVDEPKSCMAHERYSELFVEQTISINGMQAAKRAEINAGFDAAMTASLTMPSASTPPSPFSVYQAIETWKTDDPDGYATLLSIHEARRTALLAAVDAATTPEAVQAIAVSYAV